MNYKLFISCVFTFLCSGCIMVVLEPREDVSITIIPFHYACEDYYPHIFVQRLGDEGAQIVSWRQDIRYLPGFATLVVRNMGTAAFSCAAFSGKEWRLIYEGYDGRNEVYPVWPLKTEKNGDFKHPDLKIGPLEMEATILCSPDYSHIATILGRTSGKVYVEYTGENVRLVSNKIDATFFFPERGERGGSSSEEDRRKWMGDGLVVEPAEDIAIPIL